MTEKIESLLSKAATFHLSLPDHDEEHCVYQAEQLRLQMSLKPNWETLQQVAQELHPELDHRHRQLHNDHHVPSLSLSNNSDINNNKTAADTTNNNVSDEYLIHVWHRIFGQGLHVSHGVSFTLPHHQHSTGDMDVQVTQAEDDASRVNCYVFRSKHPSAPVHAHSHPTYRITPLHSSDSEHIYEVTLHVDKEDAKYASLSVFLDSNVYHADNDDDRRKYYNNNTDGIKYDDNGNDNINDNDNDNDDDDVGGVEHAFSMHVVHFRASHLHLANLCTPITVAPSLSIAARPQVIPTVPRSVTIGIRISNATHRRPQQDIGDPHCHPSSASSYAHANIHPDRDPPHRSFRYSRDSPMVNDAEPAPSSSPLHLSSSSSTVMSRHRTTGRYRSHSDALTPRANFIDAMSDESGSVGDGSDASSNGSHAWDDDEMRIMVQQQHRRSRKIYLEEMEFDIHNTQQSQFSQQQQQQQQQSQPRSSSKTTPARNRQQDNNKQQILFTPRSPASSGNPTPALPRRKPDRRLPPTPPSSNPINRPSPATTTLPSPPPPPPVGCLFNVEAKTLKERIEIGGQEEYGATVVVTPNAESGFSIETTGASPSSLHRRRRRTHHHVDTSDSDSDRDSDDGGESGEQGRWAVLAGLSQDGTNAAPLVTPLRVTWRVEGIRRLFTASFPIAWTPPVAHGLAIYFRCEPSHGHRSRANTAVTVVETERQFDVCIDIANHGRQQRHLVLHAASVFPLVCLHNTVPIGVINPGERRRVRVGYRAMEEGLHQVSGIQLWDSVSTTTFLPEASSLLQVFACHPESPYP